MGDLSRTFARFGVLATVSAAGSGEALAGAWVQAPGDRLEISNVALETGEFGQNWTSDLHIEYGVADGWGLSAKIASQFRYGVIEEDRFAMEAGVQRSASRLRYSARRR